jgi:glycosyltransferase involved in cell wall biosynthesis
VWQTRTTCRVLPELLQAKVRLIYHGVDVEAFSPPVPSESNTLILSIGRLVEKKGFSDLLEAFRQLKESGFDFNAVIYGDGPLRKELAARIHQTGLDERVTLAGSRRQDELVPIFQNSTLFALTPPSYRWRPTGSQRWSSNGLRAACGEHGCGGDRSVVNDYNGLLFQPHDVWDRAGLAVLLSDEPPEQGGNPPDSAGSLDLRLVPARWPACSTNRTV